MKSSDIHPRAIRQEIFQLLITEMSFNNTYIQNSSHISQGAKSYILQLCHVCAGWHPDDNVYIYYGLCQQNEYLGHDKHSYLGSADKNSISS